MNELRAPDPTLSLVQPGSYVYLSGVDVGLRVAHTVGGGCGSQLFHPERATDARWFAVPCRECFPDAPPPGHRWFMDPGGYPVPGDDLSWQTRP